MTICIFNFVLFLISCYVLDLLLFFRLLFSLLVQKEMTSLMLCVVLLFSALSSSDQFAGGEWVVMASTNGTQKNIDVK